MSRIPKHFFSPILKAAAYAALRIEYLFYSDTVSLFDDQAQLIRASEVRSFPSAEPRSWETPYNILGCLVKPFFLQVGSMMRRRLQLAHIHMDQPLPQAGSRL